MCKRHPQQKTHYRNMNPARASEIRRAYFNREGTQLEIARRFGIRQSSVSRIISGVVWAEAT